MINIFNIVSSVLFWISPVSGLTYNEINILVYYFIVPLVYLYLADRIIKRYILSISYIAVWAIFLVLVSNFSAFSDRLFDRSAKFLNSFSWIGWNYTEASVVICVILPLILLLVLIYFAFPKLLGWGSAGG